MVIAFNAVDELEKSQVSAFKTDGNVAVATLVDDFPKYAKDMIINIVEANTKINHFIAQHIIDTSNAEYKEIIKMANQSVDNNKQENKFKNVSDDEIYVELKRRKANKSAK